MLQRNPNPGIVPFLIPPRRQHALPPNLLRLLLPLLPNPQSLGPEHPATALPYFRQLPPEEQFCVRGDDSGRRARVRRTVETGEGRGSGQVEQVLVSGPVCAGGVVYWQEWHWQRECKGLLLFEGCLGQTQ
jgi:hypothetical protein